MTDLGPALLAAGFGALLGSFLNVCIYRLPRGASIAFPPSACPCCGRPIRPLENIPVLSYLLLGGTCRGCRTPISIRYPLVEILTAVMCGLAYASYGPGLLLASRIVFGAALIVLFAIDLEHHLLPNSVTLPGIVVGFTFSCISSEPGWIASLVGILLGGGVLFALAEGYYWIRREEGLGMGDVKMLAMIGAFIGWKLTLVTLMLASVSGSLIGLALIATGRGDMKYALPFGTFLALGAALSATVGPSLVSWYVGLL